MSNGLSWHYAIKDGRVVDNKFDPDEENTLKHNEQKEPNEKTKGLNERSAE